MPAADRMLLLRSSSLLATCMGLRITAAADTTTEQTTHSRTVTSIVLRIVSLLADITLHPPLDIGLHNKVVNQRREKVGKQNRQHHAFREGRVGDTDQHYHHTDQGTKHPFAGIGHGS